ncbi:MAG: hypothetical protein JWM36_3925 [Hyphomicrobiales bacterium]|nr:hypothetical protein [Hyphomicrobiales bacterium]
MGDTKTRKFELTDEQVSEANRRGVEARELGPVVEKVNYEPTTNKIVLTLAGRVELHLPVERIPELREATADEMTRFEITPSQLGIRWPELDVDLYVPSLLAEHLGGIGSAAQALGRAGGQKTTVAKAVAARQNGLKGGRPPKGLMRLR